MTASTKVSEKPLMLLFHQISLKADLGLVPDLEHFKSGTSTWYWSRTNNHLHQALGAGSSQLGANANTKPGASVAGKVLRSYIFARSSPAFSNKYESRFKTLKNFKNVK